jgi:hypothetical protein
MAGERGKGSLNYRIIPILFQSHTLGRGVIYRALLLIHE